MVDGVIPANLHYVTPNPDIPSLSDGRITVLTENTKWAGGYVGMNSFGFGGSNVHTLLKSKPKQDCTVHPGSSKLRLATFAARTEEGVQHVLDEMQNQSHNVPLQALLQENATPSTKTHRYRGYTILNSEGYSPKIQARSLYNVYDIANFIKAYNKFIKEYHCIRYLI
jgi:fatty acid synthase